MMLPPLYDIRNDIFLRRIAIYIEIYTSYAMTRISYAAVLDKNIYIWLLGIDIFEEKKSFTNLKEKLFYMDLKLQV